MKLFVFEEVMLILPAIIFICYPTVKGFISRRISQIVNRHDNGGIGIERDGVKRDIISELPDEILHEILYFTGTRQAVQTSVLSKRWMDLWKYLPYLNFDASEFSQTASNANIRLYDHVQQVMQHRYSNCGSVRRIRLATLHDSENALLLAREMLLSWIIKYYTLVGSAEIELFCAYRCEPMRPQMVRYVRLRCFVNKLHSIDFWNCIQSWSQRLQLVESGFQMLENISIGYCNFKSIKISQSRLKVLRLWHCKVLDGPIRVVAPNLISLDCRQISSKSLYLENSSNSTTLNDAILDFTIDVKDEDDQVDNVKKMMDALHNVKSLTLSNSLVKVLSMMPVGSYPTLYNLRHVVIILEKSDQSISVKKYLLSQWPNLQALEIKYKW